MAEAVAQGPGAAGVAAVVAGGAHAPAAAAAQEAVLAGTLAELCGTGEFAGTGEGPGGHTRLLDVRGRAAYEAGHVAGSANLFFDPAAPYAWEGRAFVLPPGGTRIAVLAASAEQWAACHTDLRDRKIAVERAFVLDAAAAKAAAAAAAAAAGGGAAAVRWEVGLPETMPILWRPNDSLGAWAAGIEKARADLGAAAPPMTAVDVACGSGRDAVWLARRGWRVLGVDRQQTLLDCMHTLAETCRVSDQVETLCFDLEAGLDAQLLPDKTYGVVHVCRYLHRELFPTLKRLVAPGGILVYSTFLVGAAKPRKAKHKLQNGELERLFPPQDWTIIFNDPNGRVRDGRPAASIAVQKKLPAAPTESS